MPLSYRLRATLSDGFAVDLDGLFPSIEAANRAAARYIRDYSDPCGVGARVAYVSVIEVA